VARLTISLLGSLEIVLDDQPVTYLATGKARALLAYLAVEAGHAHRRETLAGLLWPDYEERSARANLRNALSNLRKAIEDRPAIEDRGAVRGHREPFLLTTRETIQFNRASDHWIDVVTFGKLVQADVSTSRQLEEALALYRGPFMEGFSVEESAAYEDWISLVRERLQRQALAAYQRLIEQVEGQSEYERACALAWSWVELAPWQESAHRALMRLLALSGQRGAALAQYETCRRALREELDVEPGDETRRLYERIRDGELAPPKQEQDVGAKPAGPSIRPRETEANPIPPRAQPIAPTLLPPVSPPPGDRPEPAEGGIQGELEGERRVITAIFAHITGSTALAGQVDTEDWVEIMSRALHILSAEVHRYGGQVDRYEGDGLVAFFGLSAAHEDDAERAVLAGLAMQEAIKGYAQEPAERQGIELLLRVGLNTGEVIATHVGEAWQHGEATAMGRTIALAARLEHAAESGTVLVGEHTYRLVQRAFEWQVLGGISAQEYSEPVKAYRPLQHRMMLDKGRGVEGLESPLVGRHAEVGALEEAIERLRSGIGGIVTVVGEAGIGKSRLVTEIRKSEHLKSAPDPQSGLQWVEGRCLSYATNTIYQVWLDVVRGLLAVAPDAPPAAVRTALEEWVQAACPDCYGDVYPYMARLLSLSLDERTQAALRDLGAEGLKSYTFRAVETLVERAAGRRPLVLACEDLHWADPTSLELLQQLLPLIDRVPLLILCLFRPERSHGCWRVVETAVRDYPHCHTDLRLGPLSAAESEVLVDNLLRAENLPRAVRTGVLDHAEGNPFFVEEILRSLIDGGIIGHDEAAGRWYVTRDLADIPIPDTLHGALSARIDRLEPEPKRLLQLASVVGRIFSYPVLSAISRGTPLPWGEGPGVRVLDTHLLGQLVTLERAQLVRERTRLPEREYIFKHHLTHLLKRERRAYHRQVAEALERLYPERIEERVELLAFHWEQAGEADKAIRYLHQAGDKAVQQSAYQEGRAHLTRALDLLMAQPDAPERAERELALQLSIAMAWWGGAPAEDMISEGTKAFTRARELCLQTGKTSQLSRILGMLAMVQYLRADHKRACELGEEALDLAQRAGDPLLIAMGHWHLGPPLFALGQYTAARAHLAQTIAAYEPQDHHAHLVLHGSDAGLGALAYDALCLWCLGYPDQASKRSQEALARARELGHLWSLFDPLCYGGCLLNQISRDAQALKDHAEALMRLASETVPTLSAMGLRFRGEALVMLGQIQEGMAQLREGLAAFQPIDARLTVTGALGSLAEAQAKAGQPQEGLATLTEAFELMEKTGERHWEAELHRIRAELLLMQGDQGQAKAGLQAERSFQQAIEVARRQQAKSWELRATTSLARLWRQQGRVDEACQILAEVYGWFSEGFDTADLREAKALLEALSP